MPPSEQKELIGKIKSLGTYKDDEGNVELTMPGLRERMVGFAKGSFIDPKGIGAELTAEKIGVDLRMNQMIDTIVDLMEDLDKEYSKDYGVKLGDKYEDVQDELDKAEESKKALLELKKDVHDTFAKLGLLLKEKGIDVSKVGKGDLEAGFERARKTRNVMENIRNMPMFSEFKYADLNKNLTKTLFDGVLLDPKKNEEIPSAFYKAFEDSKKEAEEEIENAKGGEQVEKKEIKEAVEQIESAEKAIEDIENKIETAKKMNTQAH